MSEPQGVPATHLQPRPREPTRLMKTFFSLFSRLPEEPRLLRPPCGRDRIRLPVSPLCKRPLVLTMLTRPLGPALLSPREPD